MNTEPAIVQLEGLDLIVVALLVLVVGEFILGRVALLVS